MGANFVVVASQPGKWFQADITLQSWTAGTTLALKWSEWAQVVPIAGVGSSTAVDGMNSIGKGDTGAAHSHHVDHALFEVEKVFFATEKHAGGRFEDGHSSDGSSTHGGHGGEGQSRGEQLLSFVLRAPASTEEKAEPAVRFRAKGPVPKTKPSIFCTGVTDVDSETTRESQRTDVNGGDGGIPATTAPSPAPPGPSETFEAIPTQQTAPMRRQALAGNAFSAVLFVSLAICVCMTLHQRCLERGADRDDSSKCGSRARCSSQKNVMKDVRILSENGIEQSASLSLEGLDCAEEAKEALAELVAEVLDDDAVSAEDLSVDLLDERGRRKPLMDSTPISALLRAHSLRAQCSGARHSCVL